MEEVFENRVSGEKFGFGWCYLEAVPEQHRAKAIKELGKFPGMDELQGFLVKLTMEDEEEEFGPWQSWAEGDSPISYVDSEVEYKPFEVGGQLVALHVTALERGQLASTTVPDLVRASRDCGAVVGARYDELVAAVEEVPKNLEQFAVDVLQFTSAVNEDAAHNYARLGDYMEDIHERGGFKDITRSHFVGLISHLVSRWTHRREAVAAARLAAHLVFDPKTEPWSPSVFEDAMEINESEESKQDRLINMAGLVFRQGLDRRLEARQRRQIFNVWRADALAPAKAFCRAVDVDDEVVERALNKAVELSVPMMAWAASTLKAAAIPAVKALATVASGGLVSVTVLTAAGLALDWYYADVATKKFGKDRVATADGFTQANVVTRAKELFSVGVELSDESYDLMTHTNFVRVDPFFFSVRADFSRMKDDTAANRMLSNALLPPLLDTIGTRDKTVIKMPATISDESARHIQEALPEFYFRIVNRGHSHPALWATRRGFEMVTARSIVTNYGCSNVVMIGGNVRQVSKIPGVVVNYGPQLTGRDNFRHEVKGTESQIRFFGQVTLNERFGSNPSRLHSGATGVAFYSLQDVTKEDFLKAAIRAGIRKHYIALNIPVVMLDGRVSLWEDNVLGVRYERRGSKLSMTPLDMPVSGYINDFDATMSWARPFKPIYGYDVQIDTIAHVGSSYLMEVNIGVGPQEASDTIWKMPDAGHYVLHDLTRESSELRFYTVPAQKFDLVVKFVLQLNGAKNVVEAVAGRMLGLESQIKIGGNVIERAWHTNHREFASTMVHALVSAGLDKSDALYMLGHMRNHFSQLSNATFFERAKRGYVKLLGWQRDERLPGKANRGASDYDPVTHWTSRQSAGVGFGETFSCSEVEGQTTGKRPCNEQSGDSINRASTKRTRFATKASHARAETTDEGYVTAEDLNNEDVAGGGESSEPFLERMGKWFRPSETKGGDPETGNGKFSGFRPTSFDRQVVMAVDLVRSLSTTSRFDPGGAITFDGGSLSNQAFARKCQSSQDVKAQLSSKCELPAPDGGVTQVIGIAMAMEKVFVTGNYTLVPNVNNMQPSNVVERLAQEFFAEVGDTLQIARPNLLVDGIAGSAKSTATRMWLQESRKSAAIVVPTNYLAREWRLKKIGTCVTRHKLMLSTLRGREVLVIDEVYAFTKAELRALLWKAKVANVAVIMLGDRRQQYEDGGEVSFSDLSDLGMPVLRMCVSNTMPVDALHITKWASKFDQFAELFQTRNDKVHSIIFRQRDQLQDVDEYKTAVAAANVLVAKDRAGPELHWESITDSDLGFSPGMEDEWRSISRVQGARAEHVLLLTSRFTKSEKWLADQPGLMYVACSRHSGSMVFALDQSELNRFRGLEIESIVTVQGRLAMYQARERFEAPCLVTQVIPARSSIILDKLLERGMPSQRVRFFAIGAIREDWRPWVKFARGVGSTAEQVFSATTAALVGQETPYVETEAVHLPLYQRAMGLSSLRRPERFEQAGLSTKFAGLSRLAVLQNSRDELLDQKNVIERTARPRSIDECAIRIEQQAQMLFDGLLNSFFDTSTECSFSIEPSASDWAASRTTEFATKLATSDPYGLTSFSVTSQGFLKTQTKVKLKRNFAMEENYGQTVLASPADFNAMFGPWSKMFLRNLRLASRSGVVLDTGFSDKELARHLRRLGLLPTFSEENYQADVKRQDTSHTPVTLRVFCKLMVFFGIPENLANLYEVHSTRFSYKSMHTGLYKGEARYNLGSGDPFTLIRNIIEVLTVMYERFGTQFDSSAVIVKGDDFLSNKIPVILPVCVQEIRDTQLTEDFNKPPYHAGRFFLEDDILPDPVRMVSKILVKETSDLARLNQLAESFYDRYVHLTVRSYDVMRQYVVEAYADFDPEFPLSALELYHALRDRPLFYELVGKNITADENAKLVVLNTDNDCIFEATRWFTAGNAGLPETRDEPVDVVCSILDKFNIPNYRVTGRKNDFLKRGIWLTNDHAWAVVGLTEFNDKEVDRNDNNTNN